MKSEMSLTLLELIEHLRPYLAKQEHRHRLDGGGLMKVRESSAERRAV